MDKRMKVTGRIADELKSAKKRLLIAYIMT